MATPRLAVIQFPGSNCEYETQRAATHYGFQADIVRWNANHDALPMYDAYILPGGFSYQDRVRSGAIAAKLPIMESIAGAASEGKLILGICNGCQVLAESGLVTEMAMAPNTRDNAPVGFICNWQYVRVDHADRSPFTRYFSAEDVVPIPINHGEGRFVLSEHAIAALDQSAVFRYVSELGEPQSDFPINPNGATENLAGLSNPSGNVFAMMPHPERAAFLKQVPVETRGSWGSLRRALGHGTTQVEGPWEKLFVGMVDYTKARI